MVLRFFPQKQKYTPEESSFSFDPNNAIPKHIAIIMDGNGRWAQNRRLPRIAGHKEGMETVKKNYEACQSPWGKSVNAVCFLN